MTRTANKWILRTAAAAALGSVITLAAPLAPASAGSLDQAVSGVSSKGLGALRGFFLPGVMPRASLAKLDPTDTATMTLAAERPDTVEAARGAARPRVRTTASHDFGGSLDKSLAFLPVIAD